MLMQSFAVVRLRSSDIRQDRERWEDTLDLTMAGYRIGRRKTRVNGGVGPYRCSRHSNKRLLEGSASREPQIGTPAHVLMGPALTIMQYGGLSGRNIAIKMAEARVVLWCWYRSTS